MVKNNLLRSAANEESFGFALGRVLGKWIFLGIHLSLIATLVMLFSDALADETAWPALGWMASYGLSGLFWAAGSMLTLTSRLTWLTATGKIK
jgi:hypothetical protein